MKDSQATLGRATGQAQDDTSFPTPPLRRARDDLSHRASVAAVSRSAAATRQRQRLLAFD